MDDLNTISRSLHAYSETLSTLDQFNKKLNENYKAIEDEVKDLRSTNLMLQATVGNLETKIKTLEEEKAAFCKVSQIIAMEKENARLLQEISQLKKHLESKPSPPPVPPVQVNQANQANQDQYDSYVIKKIKGTRYYVSDKDRSVYTILEDDEVGVCVGKLVDTKNGKISVEWST